MYGVFVRSLFSVPNNFREMSRFSFINAVWFKPSISKIPDKIFLNAFVTIFLIVLISTITDTSPAEKREVPIISVIFAIGLLSIGRFGNMLGR